MIAPQKFVQAMQPAVQQAARLARRLEGCVENRPKAEESTAIKAALTSSDTAAQEVILAALAEHFPGVALAAEEQTPRVADFPTHGDSLVVIDPIDGTLNSYLHGEGPYAVMVGLVNDGVYDAALLALPREGIFFDAYRGGGACMTYAGGAARPACAHPGSSGILVSYDLPTSIGVTLAARGYTLRYGCGGAIAVAPLLPGVAAGLRVPVTAPEISIRGKIGALIAHEAGMFLRREDGEPFLLELEAQAQALLVAADEKTLDDLQSALSEYTEHAVP